MQIVDDAHEWPLARCRTQQRQDRVTHPQEIRRVPLSSPQHRVELGSLLLRQFGHLPCQGAQEKSEQRVRILHFGPTPLSPQHLQIGGLLRRGIEQRALPRPQFPREFDNSSGSAASPPKKIIYRSSLRYVPE
ncbi:hypothetical protein SMICM17S_07225 [Streptomyces microflavus]